MKELSLCCLSGIVDEEDVEKAIGVLENAAAMEVEGAEEMLKEIKVENRNVEVMTEEE